VFENRGVLRRKFEPKGNEVTQRKSLQNEELSDLYCSPNVIQMVISRRIRKVGHVAHMGDRRGMYRVLVWMPEGKRPLGRPRHAW